MGYLKTYLKLNAAVFWGQDTFDKPRYSWLLYIYPEKNQNFPEKVINFCQKKSTNRSPTIESLEVILLCDLIQWASRVTRSSTTTTTTASAFIVIISAVKGSI